MKKKLFFIILLFLLVNTSSPTFSITFTSIDNLSKEKNNKTIDDNIQQEKKENPSNQIIEEINTVAKEKESVNNPLNKLVLVNKEQGLPSEFIPEDLVVPNIPFAFAGDHPKKKIRIVAAKALEKLFAKAKEDNIELVGVSGYRSFNRQKEIFDYNARLKGVEAANQYSAKPGHSEHQTGLAMDVSSSAVNYDLVEEFGETEEGRWLSKMAPEYGFIIRYPKGKENITGYQYEPWHLRYVGVEHAKKIAYNDSTLEDYLYS
jgi:D-alanyl-D-alanine carboxypeptidase